MFICLNISKISLILYRNICKKMEFSVQNAVNIMDYIFFLLFVIRHKKLQKSLVHRCFSPLGQNTRIQAWNGRKNEAYTIAHAISFFRILLSVKISGVFYVFCPSRYRRLAGELCLSTIFLVKIQLFLLVSFLFCGKK